MTRLGISNPYCYVRSPYQDNGTQNEYVLMYRNAALKDSLVRGALASYPYGYATNFTGQNVQAAMLDTNIPYPMAVGINNGINGIFQYQTPQDAFAAGAAAGRRTILITEFSTLQSGVQTLITELENLSKAQGVTAAQKTEIARLINIANQILAALEKVQNNRNEEVVVALRQVEALKGTFVQLKGQAQELATKIANGNATPTTPTTPTDGNTPIVDVDGEGGIPESTGETLEEIQNQYKSELLPIINQVMAECKDTMTPQEREAVVNKVKELKQAIKDGKEVDEVKQIYNELVAMVGQHMENAPFIRAYKEAGIDEAIQEINNTNNTEISAVDRAAVTAAKAKYDAEMKKQKNATGKEDALKALYEAIKKIDEKTAEKAGKICSKIYELANGTDWTSSQEAALESTIKSINQYKVIDILDQWTNGGYVSATGDNYGLMQTVFGEFKAQPKVKKELAEHMLKQLEEVAKKRKVNISAEAGIIRGEIKDTSFFSVWNYSAIYNAFNSIHAKLGNPITDVDRQAAAVKQEAVEQQTPADEQAARTAA